MSPDDARTQQSDPRDITLTRYVRNRAVILPEARILYVPVPKAGCSSMLWALAGVAGLSEELFEQSRSIETTPELTIHDMDVWGPAHRLGDLDDADIRQIFLDAGWFRFTVVREPVARLWSAWQSKVLVQVPQLRRRFGDEWWWPQPPQSAADVAESFQRFVAAVRKGLIDGDNPHLDSTISNAHWAPQTFLLGREGIRLDHIGRLEQLGDTVAALNEHLATRDRPGVRLRKANRSALPASPGIAAAEDRDAILRLYRRDFETFDYRPGRMEGPDRDAWMEQVERVLPLIRLAIGHNQRFAILYERNQRLRKRLARSKPTRSD